VRTAVAYFQAHPEIDVVYGEGYWIDEHGARPPRYPTLPFDPKVLERDCFICQPASFFRASAYRRCGLDPDVDPSFDYDLWIRMTQRELRFAFYFRITWPTPGSMPERSAIRRREKVFHSSMGLLKRHYGYVPFPWVFGYAAYRIDGRDQCFDPLQPSLGKYLRQPAARPPAESTQTVSLPRGMDFGAFAGILAQAARRHAPRTGVMVRATAGGESGAGARACPTYARRATPISARPARSSSECCAGSAWAISSRARPPGESANRPWPPAPPVVRRRMSWCESRRADPAQLSEDDRAGRADIGVARRGIGGAGAGAGAAFTAGGGRTIRLSAERAGAQACARCRQRAPKSISARKRNGLAWIQPEA